MFVPILLAALTAAPISDGWQFKRADGTPLLEQHAAPETRPFIHPMRAPSGKGTLTENSPRHHPWQHGLYTGLHAVNGINFWEKEKDQFHPAPVAQPVVAGDRASWCVTNVWTAPKGDPQLREIQEWTLTDHGKFYTLDLTWTLEAPWCDVSFGRWAYGGLFVRMPYRYESGLANTALNSRGQYGAAAEQQPAEWVATAMPPVEGGDPMTMAIIEHPDNPGYPNPWRVDGQYGIAPSYCIRGPWQLPKGATRVNRYRVLVTEERPEALLKHPPKLK